jgi:hypothetical protein
MFCWTPSGDEDIRAFRDESLRRRQTDAAISSGDKCHLAFEFSAHCDRSLFGRVERDTSGKAAHAVSGGQKTSARTSILSRGAALGGLLGSSNEVCAVKRARPSSLES